MKLAISNIAWSREDDEAVYQALKKLQFSAIEIAPTRISTQGYLAKRSELQAWQDVYLRYFDEVCSMQSLFFNQTQSIFQSDAAMRMYLELMYSSLDFAHRLNVRNLVFGSPGLRNVHTSEDRQRAFEFFSACAESLDTYNVSLAIEPNPELYQTNFLTTTLEALAYVKQLNQKNIGINLDLGTLIENDENIHAIITSEHKPWIKHVHISEPNLIPLELKHHSLIEELLRLLKLHEYQGYVSIEMKPGLDFNSLLEIASAIGAIALKVGIME